MENKTKKYIKNILLCVALLPYLIIIFMCMYYAITGYGYNLGNTAYGFIAIGNFLGDVLLDLWLDNPNITIPIIVLWIGYQIYYFITFERKKKEDKTTLREHSKNTSKNINYKKIVFYISIGCWCLYFASGIFAFFFGSPTGGGLFNPEIEYGMEGLVHTLILIGVAFSVIPILPISLLYIIIYIIVNKRKKK